MVRSHSYLKPRVSKLFRDLHQSRFIGRCRCTRRIFSVISGMAVTRRIVGIACISQQLFQPCHLIPSGRGRRQRRNQL